MNRTDARLNIVRTPGQIIGYLAGIIVPSTILWFFTFEKIANYWFYGSMFGFVFLLVTQIKDDNHRASIAGAINRDLILRSLLLWLPVFVLLLPGLVLAYTCDIALTNTVEYIEFTSTELHEMTSDQVESSLRTVETRKYRWWWPPDWVRQVFDQWKGDLLRSGQRHLQTTGFFLHSFFTCVYAALQATQAISIGVIATIIGRSFLHILFRVWLREGAGSVVFSLATSQFHGNGAPLGGAS